MKNIPMGLLALLLVAVLFACSPARSPEVSIDGDRVSIPGAEIVHGGEVSKDSAVVAEGSLFGVIKDGQAYVLFNSGEKKSIQLGADTTNKALAEFIAYGANAAGASAQALSLSLTTGIDVTGVDEDTITFHNTKRRWVAVKGADGEPWFLAPNKAIYEDILTAIDLKWGDFISDTRTGTISLQNQHDYKTYGSYIFAYAHPVSALTKPFDASVKAAMADDAILMAQLNTGELVGLMVEVVDHIAGSVPTVGSCIQASLEPLRQVVLVAQNAILQQPLDVKSILAGAVTNTALSLTKCVADVAATVYSVGVYAVIDTALKAVATFGWVGELVTSAWDSSTTSAFAVLKGEYSPVWLWQHGTSTPDYGVALARDGAGNIYVVGATYGGYWIDDPDGRTSHEGGADVFIEKRSGAGRLLWRRQFGTAEDDWPHAIVVGDSDTLYVVGTTRGEFPGEESAGGYGDVFLAKVNSGGDLLAVKQFGTDDADYGYALAVSDAGDIFVAGHTWGTFAGQSQYGAEDIYVAKLTPDMHIEWVKQIGSSEGDFVGRNAMAVVGGGLYIAGHTNGVLPQQTSSGGEGDAYVARFSTSTGDVVWLKQYGTSGNDYTFSLCAKEGGLQEGVYVAGYTTGAFNGQTSAGGDDYFAARFSLDGEEAWVSQQGSQAGDYAWGVAVDDGGDVIVAGQTEGSLFGDNSGGSDIFVHKLNSFTGQSVSGFQFGTQADEWAEDVAAYDNYIYVTGREYGNLPGFSGWGDTDAFGMKIAVAHE